MRGSEVLFNSRTLGATFDSKGISVATARHIDRLGRGRLELHLESIRVGETVLVEGGEVLPKVDRERRCVTYERSTVEERYTLDDDSIEQDFVLHELPARRGDITLITALKTNLEIPAADRSRGTLPLMFQGQEILQVGNAVAVDAAGRKLPLELACAEGKLRMTLPASWVAGATLPLTIDPAIGAPTILRSATTGDIQCDLAYNSTSGEYLAAWSEDGGANLAEVYVQRLSSTGGLIGSAVLTGTNRVPGTPTSEYGVTINYAPALNSYLLAWQSYPSFGGPWVIVGRILDTNAAPITAPFDIYYLNTGTPGQFNLGYPNIAFDGVSRWLVSFAQNYVVFNPTYGNNIWTSAIRLNWVSSTGTVTTQTPPIADSPTGDYEGREPKVACDSNVLLVAWLNLTLASGTDALMARTMNRSGTYLAPAATVDSQPGPNPSHSSVVASGGGGKFLLGWQDSPSNSIRGRLALADGAATVNLPAGSFTIAGLIGPFVDEAGYGPSAPRATYSAAQSAWGVVYVQHFDPDQYDLYMTPVSLSGVAGSADRLTNDLPNTETGPAIGGSSEYLVLYRNSTTTPSYSLTLRALRVGTTVPPPTPTGLTATGFDSRVVLAWTAAAGASQYAILRSSTLSGPYEILDYSTTNSYTDTAVANGVTYYYKVAGYNSSGYSPGDAGPVSATPVGPTGWNALLVVGTVPIPTNSGDDFLRLRLQNTLGYTVTIVKDSSATSANASGKAVVVISSTVTSGNVTNKFRGVTVPVVVCENAIMDDMNMTGPTAGTNYGTETTGQTTLNITNPSHPLAGGLGSGNKIVSGANPVTWGKPTLSSGAQPILIANLIVGDTSRSAIYAYDKAAMMANGFAAPARRVGFFTGDATAASMTASGWALFDAAVRWSADAPLAATTMVSAGRDANGHPVLTWQAVTGAASYRVLRSTTLGGTYSTVASSVSGLGWVDTGASATQAYFYIIQAENPGGLGPLAVGFQAKMNELFIFGKPYLRTWRAAQPNNAPNLWNQGTYVARFRPVAGWVADPTATWTLVPNAGITVTPVGANQVNLEVQKAAGAGPRLLTYSRTFRNGAQVEDVDIQTIVEVRPAVSLNVMLRFPYVVNNNVVDTNKRTQRPDVFNGTKAVRDAARNAMADAVRNQLSIVFNGGANPPVWVAPGHEGAWEQADMGFYVLADLTFDEHVDNDVTKPFTTDAVRQQFPNTAVRDGTFDFIVVRDGDDSTEALSAQSDKNDADMINVYYMRDITNLGQAAIRAWTTVNGGGKSRRTIWVKDNSADWASHAATVVHEIGHTVGLVHPELLPEGKKIDYHSLNGPRYDMATYAGTLHPSVEWFNEMQSDPAHRLKTYLTNVQCRTAYDAAQAHTSKSGQEPQ